MPKTDDIPSQLEEDEALVNQMSTAEVAKAYTFIALSAAQGALGAAQMEVQPGFKSVQKDIVKNLSWLVAVATKMARGVPTVTLH